MGLKPLGGGGGGSSAPQTVWHAHKTADTIKNNTTTLTADPHLTLTLAAGSYLLESWLAYQSTLTADFRVQWSAPEGSTLLWGPNMVTAGGNAVTSATIRGTYDIGNLISFAGVNDTGMDARPTGFLTLTNGGVFALTWAQGVADVADTILRAGSWMRLSKVA